MRIFLFLILSILLWGCSTVEVTREVIKVTNSVKTTITDNISKDEDEEEKDEIESLAEEEIKIEKKIIEEKREEEKNIIEKQQKLAEINFIGNTEKQINDLLGKAELKRLDGSVYTLRYDSEYCRLFLFFNQKVTVKRVEYFEIRNSKAELLNSKQALEQCYREFNLNN